MRPGARRALPLLAALMLATPAWAEAPVPTEAPATRIHDGAGLLTPSELDALTRERMRLSLNARAQLVVVTLRDAGGESPKDIAVRTLNAWTTGRRSAVLLVLMNPRKLYIQPGTDLADVLDEPTASAICASVVAPKLRAGDKAGAIQAGLEAIAAKVAPSDPARQAFTPEKENPTPEELQSKLDAMVAAVGGKTDGPPEGEAGGEAAPEESGSNGLMPLGVVVLALATGGGVWGLVRASQRKCYQCGERLRKDRRVLEPATYHSVGRGELHFSCRSCGSEFTEAIMLPMLQLSSSSSSSDSSWSSSSDSSSSSSSSDSSSSSSSSDGSGGGGSDW
jgi:uncharacterized protein